MLGLTKQTKIVLTATLIIGGAEYLTGCGFFFQQAPHGSDVNFGGDVLPKSPTIVSEVSSSGTSLTIEEQELISSFPSVPSFPSLPSVPQDLMYPSGNPEKAANISPNTEKIPYISPKRHEDLEMTCERSSIVTSSPNNAAKEQLHYFQFEGLNIQAVTAAQTLQATKEFLDAGDNPIETQQAFETQATLYYNINNTLPRSLPNFYETVTIDEFNDLSTQLDRARTELASDIFNYIQKHGLSDDAERRVMALFLEEQLNLNAWVETQHKLIAEKERTSKTLIDLEEGQEQPLTDSRKVITSALQAATVAPFVEPEVATFTGTSLQEDLSAISNKHEEFFTTVIDNDNQSNAPLPTPCTDVAEEALRIERLQHLNHLKNLPLLDHEENVKALDDLILYQETLQTTIKTNELTLTTAYERMNTEGTKILTDLKSSAKSAIAELNTLSQNLYTLNLRSIFIYGSAIIATGYFLSQTGFGHKLVTHMSKFVSYWFIPAAKKVIEEAPKVVVTTAPKIVIKNAQHPATLGMGAAMGAAITRALLFAAKK